MHEASDAQVGLKMVHAIQPDLVLLDILMPTHFEVNRPDCVFHANWTLIPRQTGQFRRSDAGVLV